MDTAIKIFRDMPIRRKLLLGYSTIFVFALTLGSLLLYFVTKASIEKTIENELTNSTTMILDMVRTAGRASIVNNLRGITEKNIDIIQYFYTQYEQGRLTEIQAKQRAKNILLAQTIGITGYIYCMNSQGIIQIHPSKALQGADLTSNDFIRKQLQRKKGYLEYDWANPGEPKTRPKALYMDYFAPWDWIVSATSYREEFNTLLNVDDFRESILTPSFGKTGYSYIINSKADIVIHPKLATGKNFLDAKDSSGNYFVREIVARKTGRIVYDWQGPEEHKPRDKLVIFNYIPELDWIVASSSYYEEFYQPLITIGYINLVVLLATLVLVFMVTLWINASITSPLLSLSNKIAQVDADTDISNKFKLRIDINSNDEVGKLAQYFNRFMEDLDLSNRNLKTSETKYRAIFEGAVEGIFQVNPQGRILSASPSMANMLGYSSPDELINSIKDIFNNLLVQANQKQELMDKLAQAGGTLSGHELQLYRKDRSKLWVSLQIREVRTKGNENHLDYIEGFATNISTRKLAELENAELEVKLHQSQKMEAIGTLAGGIAHDFNNMLNIIIGYAELLETSLPAKSKDRDYIELMIKASRRAADLIQQILDFSRQTKHEYIPLQLQHILNEVMKLLRGSLPETIELQKDFNPQCGYVMADPTQIHQIIMNLCTNAYHAMRDTGGTLNIELDQVSLDSAQEASILDLIPGQYVVLKVSDTGHGMDKHTLQRIFEPYFTTKKKDKGTGLGLATVHGIVKSHDGAISVDSEPDKGTSFSIYFPVLDKASVEQEEEENKKISPLQASVMFVDDSESNVTLGKIILENIGCQVLGLTSSQQALEVFRDTPDRFDLVITDQTMPEMTGYELSEKMLAIRPDIPIILVTGHSDIVDEAMAKSLGIKKYIMKPLDISTLNHAISHILAHR